MKYKVLLFITPLSLLSASLFAATYRDSIGIENLDGKKIILHKVEAKESYYSISRRYNVKPNAVIQFNHSSLLHIGEIVKVPTDQPFLSSSANTAVVNTPPQPANLPKAQPNTTVPYNQPKISSQPTTATADNSITQYKVSAGETLYAIAKRFNTSVEDIISLNSLRSNSLSPGQVLQVKSGATIPPPPAQTVIIPPAKRDSTPIPAASADSMTVERRLPSNRYGLTERNEKGVATWMDNDGLDPNKKLVLHRTAPVGTVIKITNPMTNRTTFAKVVGSFTENEMTRDVIVVMTKGTADSLGAIDKRFHINISYGVPNDVNQ